MRFLTLTPVVLLLALVACTPAAAPAPPAASKAGEKPAAKTDAKTSAEWESAVSAAKREGRLAIIGSAGFQAREALVEGFQSQYGITVEVLPAALREVLPRIATERGAGQYLWDVYIGGPAAALFELAPKTFEPIEPALILPDVKNPGTWRGGKLEFVDRGGRLLAMTPRQRATIFLNTNEARPTEFKSYRDLLDPKWRGRVATDDPRTAGPGNATFRFFYLHPELGPEFIRELARRAEVTPLRDYTQEADALGQGRYAVLLGGADEVIMARIKEGVPIDIVDPGQLREGSDLSPGPGTVAIFNQAPHPNAAKVYLNWLLSKDGQTAFARAISYVSGRLDVPTDHAPAWQVPKPGSIKTYDEDAIAVEEPLNALLREVFGQ